MTNDWLDRFIWDSDEQEQGYWGFLKWAREKGVSPEAKPIDLFFIQKAHDSSEYWRGTMADQIASLEKQIRGLQTEVNELKRKASKRKLPRVITRVMELFA